MRRRTDSAHVQIPTAADIIRPDEAADALPVTSVQVFCVPTAAVSAVAETL